MSDLRGNTRVCAAIDESPFQPCTVSSLQRAVKAATPYDKSVTAQAGDVIIAGKEIVPAIITVNIDLLFGVNPSIVVPAMANLLLAYGFVGNTASGISIFTDGFLPPAEQFTKSNAAYLVRGFGTLDEKVWEYELLSAKDKDASPFQEVQAESYSQLIRSIIDYVKSKPALINVHNENTERVDHVLKAIAGGTVEKRTFGDVDFSASSADYFVSDATIEKFINLFDPCTRYRLIDQGFFGYMMGAVVLLDLGSRISSLYAVTKDGKVFDIA